MGELHLVVHALNLSTMNAGILIMVQQVRLMMYSLNMVDFYVSFVLLAHIILVSDPVPLGLIGSLNWVGLGWGWTLGVLGLGVWVQGLTILNTGVLISGGYNGASVSHVNELFIHPDDVPQGFVPCSVPQLDIARWRHTMNNLTVC